jgi:hypothetical protein
MEKNIYPIGKFEFGKSYSNRDNAAHISRIGALPGKLNKIAEKLDDKKLELSYRPGGWTGRQIIHHIADSHLNAYIRTKSTLTEENTVIKPYNQDLWAALPDSTMPVAVSLNLVDSIHQRWVHILQTLEPEQLKRKYIHPEYKKEFSLEELLALYAWHGDHHCGQLEVIGALSQEGY